MCRENEEDLACHDRMFQYEGNLGPGCGLNHLRVGSSHLGLSLGMARNFTQGLRKLLQDGFSCLLCCVLLFFSFWKLMSFREKKSYFLLDDI